MAYIFLCIFNCVHLLKFERGLWLGKSLQRVGNLKCHDTLVSPKPRKQACWVQRRTAQLQHCMLTQAIQASKQLRPNTQRKMAAFYRNGKKGSWAHFFNQRCLLHDKWPTIAINNNRYNTTSTKTKKEAWLWSFFYVVCITGCTFFSFLLRYISI